jgi:hypothetical protein
VDRLQVQRKGPSRTNVTRAWIHIRIRALERCVRVVQDTSPTRLTDMQLSAQLKTRLSYAMVKVQNGWEKQSLEELEEVHSQKGSPNSAPGGSRAAFDSPSTTDYRRRSSAISDSSDYMMMSPASESTRSHAVNSGKSCDPSSM